MHRKHVSLAIVLGMALSLALAGNALAATVASWHMEERSGTVMHDSVRTHNGTIHGVTLGVPGFFSPFGYAFTGSSYVSVPSAADLNPGSADLTVTVWMKTTKAPSTPDWDLLRKGVYTTSGGEWKVEYQPSGQATCAFKGSGGYAELTAGPNLRDGAWHGVRCRKTSAGVQLGIIGTNGTTQTFSKSAKLGSMSNTSPVVVGAHPGSEYFQGTLDEATIAIG